MINITFGLSENTNSGIKNKTDERAFIDVILASSLPALL